VRTLALALLVVLAIASRFGQSAPASRPYTTWRDYGGASDSMQYSALTQINKTNVATLEQAWFFPVPDKGGNLGFNPIVVDGVMYLMGPQGSIVAVEAATGKQIWSHRVEGAGTGGRATRGISYWENPERSDRRLIFGAGSGLREIDARSGASITSFGDNGRVDMRTGPVRPLGGPSATPGRVFENLFLTGSQTGEGYGSTPGDLRAYDIVTGKLAWTFHTIPYPGEFGYDTWPESAWKWAGGVNTWGEISIDEKRGIAYFPLGSPTHDMFGGDRKGANLFGNCLLALDARTGKRLWHFQTVHHDLWDYDLTTAPKLLTVRHNGAMVDVVAQATKFGLLYVFNRVTGEPLWPIEERPVPKSDVPGEESYPTQPFPTKPPPFARLKLDITDINPYLDDQEKERLRGILRNARNEGLFTPQSLTRDQISIPGELGGSNWGGAAADPTTGILYVRTADQPGIHKLREANLNETPSGGAASGPPRPPLPQLPGVTRYTARLGAMLVAKNGLLAIGPPWAELVAYDLNEGTIGWRAPLGTVRALAEKGIKNTGNARRVHRNGPVVTAGGLIFIGTNADGMVRAFDKDNGRTLWERQLEANPEGLAAVFEAGGREYLVFCTSTYESVPDGDIAIVQGKLEAQGYYVFALPQK
jgi:quinoprotein glucose dehydrogenase